MGKKRRDWEFTTFCSQYLWMDIADILKYNIVQKFHFVVPQKDLISNMGSISCITSVWDKKLVDIGALKNRPNFGSTKMLPILWWIDILWNILPGSEKGVMKFTLSQITFPLTLNYRCCFFLNISIFSTKSDWSIYTPQVKSTIHLKIPQ